MMPLKDSLDCDCFALYARPASRHVLHHLNLLEDAALAGSVGLYPIRHCTNTVREYGLRSLSENFLGLAVIGKRNLDLVARGQMCNAIFEPHHARNDDGQVVDRAGHICSDI